MTGSRWGLLDPAHAHAVPDDAVLAAMLEVEAALLEVVAARHGLGASAGAAAVRDADLDHDDLAAGARADGVPVPALVRRLRDVVGTADPAATPHVHAGATSQDVVDTALVLVARDALAAARSGLVETGRALAATARAESGTPSLARTLAQAAAPVPFGARVATWLDGVTASLAALDALRFPVQLGGPVGVGGAADRPELAARLGLDDPGRSWHVERSPVLAIGQAAATTVAALGRLGRELAALVRPEVAAIELAGGGVSSAMPHKRNPVDAVLLVAHAVRAPGLLATLNAAALSGDARPAGEWHAEWAPLLDLLGLAAGSADAAARATAGVRVDRAALARDLDDHGAGLPGDVDGGGEIVAAAVARFEAAAAPGEEEAR